MRKFFLILSITGIVHQHADAQERRSFSCLTQEQLQTLNREVRELQENHNVQLLKIFGDLKDAILRRHNADADYEQCINNSTFIKSLLGDDCTREMNAIEKLNYTIETQSTLANIQNNTTQTKLIAITNKYPHCH